MATTEHVVYRMLIMRCCNHVLPWVSPRWPTFCPECGEPCYPQVRGWAHAEDARATVHLPSFVDPGAATSVSGPPTLTVVPENPNGKR